MKYFATMFFFMFHVNFYSQDNNLNKIAIYQKINTKFKNDYNFIYSKYKNTDSFIFYYLDYLISDINQEILEHKCDGKEMHNEDINETISSILLTKIHYDIQMIFLENNEKCFENIEKLVIKDNDIYLKETAALCKLFKHLK
jgi:hypothetical protein